MSKNILICDDELGVRESIKAYLEDTYDLYFAKNGQEALTFAKSIDFDLIIIDVKMPILDGLETIREIKNLKPNQKIILLTGYESLSLVDEASKIGADSYLTKPVGKDKLLKAIANII
jgi:YesN/AraC family two-component response regulator